MNKDQESTIRPATLQVIIMPNDEVLCAGIHIGWLNDARPSFTDSDKRLSDYVDVIVQCANCDGGRPSNVDYCPECGSQ